MTAAVAAAEQAFAAASDLDQLKSARIEHAGDRSALALANREIGALPPSAKAEAGKRVGQARARVKQALAQRQQVLEAERDERVLVEEAVDITKLYDRDPAGARHPLSTIQERMADIFVAMGYDVVDGPEVESEWHNFDALNLGPDHPARSMQDTFFVESPDSGVVLRTHTSPVQIRTMLAEKPPIRIVAPGRVFRRDTPDATHMPVFHQIEGLVIDRDISLADLAGTIQAFTEAFFGPGWSSRLRPSYFPFTEPSAEFDIQRPDGSWIELGGCGVVHPNVLRHGGIDPEEWSGFAFGFGIDRMALMRHGVKDLRDMYADDLRFIKQF